MGEPKQRTTAGIVRKYCLFCRKGLTNKNATNEHVMPRWVLREFGIAERIITRQGGSAARHRRNGLTRGRDSLSATFVRTAIPDGFRI